VCEPFLQMLGLAQRAGGLRSGASGCEQALMTGQASLIVVAVDAADEVRDKLQAVAQRKGIHLVTVFSKSALGAALGKSPRAAIVITDPRFAARLWSMSQEIGGGIGV